MLEKCLQNVLNYRVYSSFPSLVICKPAAAHCSEPPVLTRTSVSQVVIMTFVLQAGFFEECICAAEIEAKLPSIMKNAVYLHKAAARRIKSCRIQRRASRRHWCKSSTDGGVTPQITRHGTSVNVDLCCALVAVKHSQSFAVTDADDRSMEELRETARRLTSDSSFRQTVYKIMARQDAATKTEK